MKTLCSFSCVTQSSSGLNSVQRLHTKICCCNHCLNTGNRSLSKTQRLIYPQNMSRIVILHRNYVAFSANSAFLFLLQHYICCSCLPHTPSFKRTWKHGMKSLRRVKYKCISRKTLEFPHLF